MPTLRVLSPEPREYLLGERTEIGRDPGVAICVPEVRMSRCHAYIERRGEDHHIVDARSSSGTFVDEQRVDDQRLRPGARIRLGGVELEFLGEPASARPARGLPEASAQVCAPDGTIRAIELREGLIGGHPRAALRVGTGFQRHARLVAFAGAFWVEALDGPVQLDGAPVLRASLRDGAALALGTVHLLLRVVDLHAPVLRVYVDADPRSFVDHPLGGRTRIGKHGRNDLVIADPQVSREHCQICRDDEGAVIEDLRSTNGTRVNGEAVQRRALRHGDRVELGRAVCVLLDPPGAPTPTLQALQSAFTAAELAAPPVPAALVPLLQALAPGWFATRRTAGLHQYGEPLLAEADDPAVKDYLIVGLGGTGPGASAMHYFLRHEGLLLLLELELAAADSDGGRSRDALARAFTAAAALIDGLGAMRRRGLPRAGLRVLASSLRGSQWQAGADGGRGDVRAVLAQARAWAGSGRPYQAPARRAVAPVLGDRDAAPVSEAEHRVRMYAEAGAEPVERRIGAELVVGRGTGCGLQLPYAGVSRQHCRFFERGGACYVEDLASTEGTRVEGRTITGACVLAHGARIRLHGVELVYCEAGRPSPPRFRPG